MTPEDQSRLATAEATIALMRKANDVQMSMISVMSAHLARALSEDQRRAFRDDMAKARQDGLHDMTAFVRGLTRTPPPAPPPSP